MSRIQITNEISTRLTRLRNVTITNTNFNRAIQFNFENNRRMTSLTQYQNTIRTVGRLARRYRTTLERDIRNCERIVTNAREREQRIAKTLR